MAQDLKNLELFLGSARAIDSICAPLKEIGIKYFTLLRNYKDGSKINLSNSADWIESYYTRKLYNSSVFENVLDLYSNGFALWEPFKQLEALQYARQSIDSDHGITLIDKADEYCDFYFYSTSSTNPQIINFYLNNLDLLQRFALYFRDRAASILKKCR